MVTTDNDFSATQPSLFYAFAVGQELSGLEPQ
jgi:hypothetical protein